jgi:signal transduction histidine kinase
MKLQIALYFLILGTVQLGLLLGVYHYKHNHISTLESKYWTSSLALSVLGLFIFSAGVFYITDVKRPAFIFTIANTLFYIASLLQMLFCISLNSTVSKVMKQSSLVSIILFMPTFDYLRQNFDFETRTIFMCGLISIFYIIQIHQLNIYINEIASKQIKYLKYATTFELLLAFSRVSILIFTAFSIRQVEQIPPILTFVTLWQLVMNTLSFIAIAGYWTEIVSIFNHRFELENERINQLLKEQNKLIYSLSIANKTASTGALAASIAHELNQPLGASNLNIQLLTRQIESNDLRPEALKEILASLQKDNTRASAIIKSLRSIFLNEETEYYPIKINSLIQEVVTIIEPELNKHQIELNLDLKYDAQINCAPSQIKQVFLNLINNSIFSLTNSNNQNKFIKLTVNLEGRTVHLDVYDNGVGIATNRQDDLFELLSGSKGTGMGLGLWLCRHILTHHGGTLENLNVSNGALFRIKMHLS